MSEELVHDLFLLMLNLSQLRSKEEILRVFVDAINNSLGAVSLRLVDGIEQSTGQTMSIATRNGHYGWIALDGKVEALPAKELALIRNAVGMLGVILENLDQERLLADENLRLEMAVKKRTADLIASNIALEEDIAERKRITEELQKSEEQFKAMFDMASIGMAQADPRTRQFLRVNSKMCEITGYSPSDLLRMRISEITHPEDREKDWDSFRNLIDGRWRNYKIEKRYLRKDGVITWVNVNMTVIRDSVGEPLRTMATIEDVTERKRAEEELRGSEARFRFLSETARRLLEENDPLQILNELAAQIMEKLDCQIFFNFLADDQAGTLRLNAYAGIPDEEARRIERLDYGVAVCGQVACDGVAVVAENLCFNLDTRTELLRSFGIQAYACHPILIGENVAGTLSFGSKTHRNFSPSDLDLMKTVTHQLATAIERKKTEDALRESLQEKTVLLKEVHHRVKNNLQVVASLLGLQAARAANLQVADVLQDTRNRVKSMALLHETLYRSGNMARVNFETYAKDLCGRLLVSYGPVVDRVKLEYGIIRIVLPLEQIVPCGLIVNELVSNALKYGFPGKHSGRISVGLDTVGGQSLVLSVRDEGVGFPPDFDPTATSTLGIQLVSRLAGQLGGQLEVERPQEGGAYFRVVFPVPEDSLLEEES